MVILISGKPGTSDPFREAGFLAALPMGHGQLPMGKAYPMGVLGEFSIPPNLSAKERFRPLGSMQNEWWEAKCILAVCTPSKRIKYS